MNLILSNHDILILVSVGTGVLIALIIFVVYIRRNRKRVRKAENDLLLALDIDKDIVYNPEIANVRFEEVGDDEKRKELLSKTHVEVEPGIWVDKEHALKPIVYGEMTPLIAKVIETHKEKTEGIGNLVNGVLEHKIEEERKLEVVDGKYTGRYYKGKGIMEQLPDDMDKPIYPHVSVNQLEKEHSNLKEEEEDILDLMLKFLKEK